MDALMGPARIVAPERARFLPPEAPMAMPEQSLRDTAARVPPPSAAPRALWLRRAFILLATIAMTAFAAVQMYQVLAVSTLTILETAVLVLFVVLFAWIAFSFASAFVGFVLSLAGPDRTLGLDPESALPALASCHALLVPTYNESPHRVMARLQAIYESVAESGRLQHFDFFVLSDTTDPLIWLHEEAQYLALLERTQSGQIFYRHRHNNIARKSGNIGEWVTRFGGRYEGMVVLDADSLMTGDTIVRIAAAIEQNPHIGLIQTLPLIVNGQSLFARLQQFAGRLYGPMLARGIAWWHGPEGNYWGHNAAIRVKAFADHASLPLLSGRKPFGGHILSHDFVEAALMRRAGWAIVMAPSLRGSYEEVPPSIAEYAARDRRWCQGNLQHLKVLSARRLHWVSRLHFLTGIGAYLTAPLWLVFLLAGILISLQAHFIRPEYFPKGFSLFPQWPAEDPIRAAWVFGGTMGMLIAPKLLGYIVALVHPAERRGFGGGLAAFVSVLIEIVLSGLIAPMMMLLQTQAVADVLRGRDAGWQVQRRDDGSLTAAELIRHFGKLTLIGVFLGASAYAVSLSLFLWMTPVTIGLLLAMPLAAFTARADIGLTLRDMRLLAIPEEREAPRILARANALARDLADDGVQIGALLRDNRGLQHAHGQMLSPQPPRPRGDIDPDLVIARAKAEQGDTIDEALGFLTLPEMRALLSDPQAFAQLLDKVQPAGAPGAPADRRGHRAALEMLKNDGARP
jgi:membrane glycosyltransferase